MCHNQFTEYHSHLYMVLLASRNVMAIHTVRLSVGYTAKSTGQDY